MFKVLMRLLLQTECKWSFIWISGDKPLEAKWYCNSNKVAEVALGLLLNSSRIPHSLPSKETGKIHRNSNNNKDRASGRIQGGKIPPQKKRGRKTNGCGW
jgi:hypothetical protein